MTNIYVGNLSFDATEEDIRQAFAEFGDVQAVNIIKDRETGRPRGFAFVEMSDGEQAKEAIEKLNLSEIAGRSVTVERSPTQGGSSASRWWRRRRRSSRAVVDLRPRHNDMELGTSSAVRRN